MTDRRMLARRFETERPRLRAIATRLLGSAADADDAVQETWLRLERVDAAGIDNLEAWLTTVVSRVSLDLLRAPRRKREHSWQVEPWRDEPVAVEADPAELVAQSDQVSVALLVLLETLSPAERIALVLHDVFGRSFDEIADVLDRSPEAARQLASRARRRVRGADEPAATRPRTRPAHRGCLARPPSATVTSRALLELLDDGAVLRADYGTSVQLVEGAQAIAEQAVLAGSARRTLDSDPHRRPPGSRGGHARPGGVDHGVRARRRPDRRARRPRGPDAAREQRGRPGPRLAHRAGPRWRLSSRATPALRRRAAR